jgi:hypothetical protein
MRTNVADMPGYPTRKLLFGGPVTRTKAGTCVRSAAIVEAMSRPYGWSAEVYG